MPREPATGHELYHGETLSPGLAVTLAGMAVFAIYATQIVVGAASVPVLVAAVAGDAVVLVALAFYARRRGIRRAPLGLRRPAPIFFAAAALIGVSAWLVSMWLVALLHVHSDTSRLQALVDQPSLPATVLALAVMPAITEEIVFRGILARALVAPFSPAAAIGMSALVFGLYHLVPAQMISTFVFGLSLGILSVRARSAIPAMLAHFLNNTIALVVSREEVPGLWPWIAAHPVPALGTSILLLTAGLVIAVRAGGGVKERGR